MKSKQSFFDPLTSASRVPRMMLRRIFPSMGMEK